MAGPGAPFRDSVRRTLSPMTSSSQPLRYSDAGIADLISIWEGVARDLIALGRDCDVSQWAAATPCPGWSVGDLIAHLIGIERRMMGEPPPDHAPDWANLPHAQGFVGQFTELDVDFRRTSSQANVLVDANEGVAKRLEHLRSGPQERDAEVPGVMGRPVPNHYMISLRTFDIWAHGQDARTALNRPGDLGGAGAWISAGRIISALPIVVAKAMSTPPGTLARIDVTPSVTDSVEFTRLVLVDPDKRGDFVDDTSTTLEPTFGIRCDWDVFSRIACGRLDLKSDAVRDRVSSSGDHAMCESFLIEIGITP